MAPANIQTVRQLIYWEFAALITESGQNPSAAKIEHNLKLYKEFDRLGMSASEIIRSYPNLQEGITSCAICGKGPAKQLKPSLLIALPKLYPLIMLCHPCDKEKAQQDVLSWFSTKRSPIPAPVLSKILYVIFESFDEISALDLDITKVSATNSVKGISDFLKQKAAA